MDVDIKVLVVDDFSTMRKIIKNNLRSMGFDNIVEAENGQKALDELNKGTFGLIIADWNMPVMTGIELLKAVRSDDDLKGIPFIMVTAEGQKDNVIKAAEAGVSNYIVKPFTPDTFSEKLKKVLA